METSEHVREVEQKLPGALLKIVCCSGVRAVACQLNQLNQKQELDVFIKKTEDEILSFNQQITNLDIDVNVMTEVNKLFRNNTSEEFTKIKDVVSENLGENLY